MCAEDYYSDESGSSVVQRVCSTAAVALARKHFCSCSPAGIEQLRIADFSNIGEALAMVEGETPATPSIAG